jgi:hypothetical protein
MRRILIFFVIISYSTFAFGCAITRVIDISAQTKDVQIVALVTTDSVYTDCSDGKLGYATLDSTEVRKVLHDGTIERIPKDRIQKIYKVEMSISTTIIGIIMFTGFITTAFVIYLSYSWSKQDK